MVWHSRVRVGVALLCCCLPFGLVYLVACCFVELVASFGFWSFAKYLSFSLNVFLLLSMVTLFSVVG